MAKHISSSMDGLKLGDLLNDGITFEIGGELDTNNEEEEEFAYSPYVQFSNEEMLNMLNMNDFDDEDDNDNDDKGIASLCGISFSELKTKMTSLTTDEKVMKHVKQNGVGEIVPQDAQVIVHYIGYFEYRDEPFDSTYSCGKPRTLRLNQSYIIPGLELGIRSMRKHEVSVFLIHPDLAYKSFGCPPRIPPNEEVVFVVHLIDYVDDGSALTYQDLTVEERQSFSNVEEPVKHMLVTAKDHFKKRNFKRAINEYRKVVNCLETIKLKDKSEEESMNELLSRANTNLGLCYNKENLPFKACIALRQVPNPSAKSYYHFGKALLSIGEYSEAMKELQKALNLSMLNELESSETIRKTIQITNKQQREFLEKEKRLWKNCFGSKEQSKLSEFRKAAHDLCENFIHNEGVIRQSLSEGFTKEEYEIIREEAAVLGLNVVTSNRYNKETIYLQKSKS